MIGDITAPMMTRSKATHYVHLTCYVSLVEPKNIDDALKDNFWINVMQEELNQFVRHYVWYLIPRPTHTNVIGAKWILEIRQMNLVI